MDGERRQDSCKQWLADETKVHERAEYGANNAAVTSALREQQRRTKLVTDYKKEVTTVTAAAKVGI